MNPRRMLTWLGSAGADAVGRFVIQILTTAALARLLAPDAFGQAAIVMSAMTFLATLGGGAPFEEALVQQARVRRGHFETALAASFLLSAGFTALIVAVSWPISRAFAAPEIAPLFVAACPMLFVNAAVVVLMGLARRRRRFNTIATSSLVGHVVGGAAAVALAAAGAGAWAIVSFRIVTLAVQAVVLSAGLGVVIWPRWRAARLREFVGIAGVFLGERLVEQLQYLLFNYAVGAVFGLASLGQLNMAMRFVEPLRGAIGAISHNLAYPSLMRAVRGGGDVAAAAEEATVATAVIAAPAFLGVAGVSATLMALLAGPGWEEAAQIIVLLAAGGALMAGVSILNTTTQIRGRPDLNLIRRVIGLVVMVPILLAAAPLGALAAGLARAGADAIETLWASVVARRVVGLSLPAFLRAAGLPLAAAALMAVAVDAVGRAAAFAQASWGGLVLEVAVGAAIYAMLLALFARGHLRMIPLWLGMRVRS